MKNLKLKSRHQLRKSQYRKMINMIKSVFQEAEDVLGKKRFELASVDNYELLLVDGKPLFFMIEGQPFFTIKGALELQPKQRLITIDTGAVPFIAKGADVMKPGIVSADPCIREGDMVIIVEETYGKPLAIGRALVSADQMTGDDGKAVKTILKVGDKLWNLQL